VDDTALSSGSSADITGRCDRVLKSCAPEIVSILQVHELIAALLYGD
jgi:hypothetical protein